MLEISEQYGMRGQEWNELIISKQTKRQVGEMPAQLVQFLHKRGSPITSGSEEFIEIANWHAFQIIPDLKVQYSSHWCETQAGTNGREREAVNEVVQCRELFIQAEKTAIGN